jgi:hypothetical protein
VDFTRRECSDSWCWVLAKGVPLPFEPRSCDNSKSLLDTCIRTQTWNGIDVYTNYRSAQTMTFPGFMMPLGSNNCLIFFIHSRLVALFE